MVYILRMNGYQKAIDILGSQVKLALKLGVNPMTVSQWKRRGIPGKRVIPIYRATGGMVTPHELRPDLYPDSSWLPPSPDESVA